MANLQIPRGLTITYAEVTDRMYHEQEVLRRYFPDFELVPSKSNGRYAARGVLSTELDLYGMRVNLPGNYPYGMPDIEPVGWQATGPHTYSNGHLCMMKSEQWRNAYTVALIVAKAAIWVNKYEVYKRDKTWPGNEQLHGMRAVLRSVGDWLEKL